MKKSLLTILVILLVAGTSFSQEESSAVYFSIIVGSCFETDSIDISINGQKIIDDVVVASDANSGITQLSAYQNEYGLWILNRNVKTNYGGIDVNKTLSLDVKINGELTSRNVNLRKGRYLVINNCYMKSEKDKLEKTITVDQYKRTIVLE